MLLVWMVDRVEGRASKDEEMVRGEGDEERGEDDQKEQTEPEGGERSADGRRSGGTGEVRHGHR